MFGRRQRRADDDDDDDNVGNADDDRRWMWGDVQTGQICLCAEVCDCSTATYKHTYSERKLTKHTRKHILIKTHKHTQSRNHTALERFAIVFVIRSMRKTPLVWRRDGDTSSARTSMSCPYTHLATSCVYTCAYIKCFMWTTRCPPPVSRPAGTHMSLTMMMIPLAGDEVFVVFVIVIGGIVVVVVFVVWHTVVIARASLAPGITGCNRQQMRRRMLLMAAIVGSSNDVAFA